MTTEPRAERREPRLRLSPLELRLYLVALLAAAYTLSWRAVGGHDRSPASETAPVASAPRHVRAPVASAPRVVRTPARAPRRVRTRSS